MINLKKQFNRIALAIIIIVTSWGNCFAQYGQYRDFLAVTGDDIVSLRMITLTPNNQDVAGELRLNQKLSYGNNFIGFANKDNIFLNYTNSFGDFYVKNKIKVGMNGGWPHAKLGFDTTRNDDFVIGILDFSNNFYGFGYRSNGELRVQSGTNGNVTFGRRTGPNDGDFVENIRFVSNGNVGIGIATPAHKLDVNGEINATGFKLNGVPFTGSASSQWTTSGTSINYAAGNIGIANAAPETKLEIGTDRPGVLGTPDDIYLKVHGSATFDNNGDNALTQVSVNTMYKLEGSALTVGGPTFIGSWDETKNIATDTAPTIKKDYLSKYNLWVTLGVVSEDFAITGKDSWKDEVFKEGYKLPTLSEVETFVKQNKHLPGVPSEKEVMEKGYTVHQMNNAFLEKIEHLVLYSIEQEKKLKEQTVYTNTLEKNLQEQVIQMNTFKARLEAMETKLKTIK